MNVLKTYRVKPGARLHLNHVSASDHRFCADKETAKKETLPLLEKIDQLQTLLYANKTQALLIILQGMDTAGKDGTIRHVMSGINPQGCQVASFKVPTDEERAHDFLWRIHQKTPPKGYIGIFNRSHYEDVLVTRVHKLIDTPTAEKRFKAIRQFEKLLSSNGTTILKFFLHISKDEQRERLESRIRNPQKRWKMGLEDLKERAHWATYQRFYEEALSATSSEYAPWFIIPADHKWYRNRVVAQVVLETLKAMNLKVPRPNPAISFKTLKVL